jgi:hypothetical protein
MTHRALPLLTLVILFRRLGDIAPVEPTTPHHPGSILSLLHHDIAHDEEDAGDEQDQNRYPSYSRSS